MFIVRITNKTFINKFDNLPDHHTLLTGIIPPNATQLLANGNFEKIISQAKKDYDYIVIDTAPTLLVTDTLLISDHADVILYICRSNFTEKSEKFNLSELIMSTAKKYENKNILVNQESEIFFSGRKNLIQRCLNNLLDNAINFSKNIKVTQQRIKRNILIFVEDDGPGIPSSEYENVFKPFYKLDKSRNKT